MPSPTSGGAWMYVEQPYPGMTVKTITASSFLGTVTRCISDTETVLVNSNTTPRSLLFYFQNSALPQELTFTVTFDRTQAENLQLATSCDSTPFSSLFTTPLDLTNLGIVTGHVMNVEFNVYSHCSSASKTLSKPRKVFASSKAILGKSEYIDDCELGIVFSWSFQ